MWPSPSYWVTLAANYGLTYNGTKVDTELAQKLQAYDIEGVEIKSEDQHLMVMIDKLKKHIKDNFLMASFFHMNPHRIINLPKVDC